MTSDKPHNVCKPVSSCKMDIQSPALSSLLQLLQRSIRKFPSHAKKKKSVLKIIAHHTGTLFLTSHSDNFPLFRTDVFIFQEIIKRQNGSLQKTILSPGCPLEMDADVSSIKKLLTSIWLL